ncbi:glycosyltransferase family 2 protein [Geofilum sp. OHC36d9]|uniref:glycosyltransferase family 2 protein n=1 Tax=Geofilum sp. OHC36d9 TaxID=3458413 RepID=UPI00403422E2
MEKIISIVIATYNASDKLERCLSSIVQQKNELCELVLIDGGSTDSTLDIIKSYSRWIDVFVSENDAGVYDAWNKGVRLSNGKWIMFIGADDILLTNAIEKFLNVISRPNIYSYDYICAFNEYVDNDGKLLKLLGGSGEWRYMRRTMTVAHVGSLHSRRLFNEVGEYDLSYKICADYELLLRKRGDLRTFFLPERIARMEVGGLSFSTRAIFETFLIRKNLQTVPTVVNFILFFRDWVSYKYFRFRNLLT